MSEEEIAQLQEEDVDTEPCTSDQSHFVGIDGTVFVSSKLLLILVHVMLLVSTSFLAKNGKKQPKAESMITQEVLKTEEMRIPPFQAV